MLKEKMKNREGRRDQLNYWFQLNQILERHEESGCEQVKKKKSTGERIESTFFATNLFDKFVTKGIAKE